MIIDTHTHLYLQEFNPDPDAAVKRAIEAGVGRMVFPNVDLSTIKPMNDLAARWPGAVAMAMGLHPTEIGGNWLHDLDTIKAELDTGRYVAVGEIGIDLYWDRSRRAEQIDAFAIQVSEAITRSLPVIIHCREGLDETLSAIDSVGAPQGVFHSFGGNADDVERIRRRGDFYFGINGIVTFKNSKLREVLPAIGLDRILLETDSPYLAPVPMRGKRNESAFIIHTAAHVAQALGLTVDEVSAATTANACRLFGFNSRPVG